MTGSVALAAQPGRELQLLEDKRVHGLAIARLTDLGASGPCGSGGRGSVCALEVVLPCPAAARLVFESALPGVVRRHLLRTPRRLPKSSGDFAELGSDCQVGATTDSPTARRGAPGTSWRSTRGGS